MERKGEQSQRLKKQIKMVRNSVVEELKFLKNFICCLAKCEEAEKDTNLNSAIVSLEAILKEVGVLTVKNDNQGASFESSAPVLLKKFEQFEPEIRESCTVLLGSLESMSCSRDEILDFIDCLTANFWDLANLETDMAVSVKEKLSFLRNFVDFTAKRCTDHQKLEDLLDYVKDLVQNAASFSLLCLLEGNDEKIAQRSETVLSDLLMKIEICKPNVSGMFIGVLKSSKSSRSDKMVVGQIVAVLADFLLEGLIEPFKDCVQILKEGLIFMITFFMDPTEEAVTNAGDGLFARINLVLEEVLSLISSSNMNESKVDCLSGFKDKINKVREEVGNLYVLVPGPSEFNFSMTNSMGFVDFFFENLQEMLKLNPRGIFFAKSQVMVIQEELFSLKPFLKEIMELQKEKQDLKDLRKRIINVFLMAERAIASCLIIDHPVWYDLSQISNVIQAIKAVKIEVKKQSGQVEKNRMTSSETDSGHVLAKQANTSILKDAVVGWKDETKMIIQKLKRGTGQLDIVSIVGMPGLGKTTMANKVYNDPSVKSYFRRSAWCCVSEMYKPRELYFDILSDVSGTDARKYDSTSTDDDLAEKLRKSLKGRRYLIVLDDIWSIEAWNSIKGSFPDDNNGSRIMFTSRIHNLVSQAKLNCSPHPLRPLSDEESWELLQEKLFPRDSTSPPPHDLSEIGKNIAKNCKGLPLAVVLVAGILVNKKIDFWKQIEERTSSQVVSEGCMDVLELSYKHLPDHLKSCFLYFGAFPEDGVVKARKLMSLWIAEGLVPRTEGKSPYEVAEDYISDLINRSLIILAERSSSGGVKACRVHDLLRDLCLAKIQEDNFLQFVRDTDVSQGSLTKKMYEIYRLCIHAEWSKFVDTEPAGPFVHSLVLLGDYQWKQFPCPSSLFNSFKLLNVLDLECIIIDGPFPEEVTLMVHLRYLAIHCHATEIPDSIASLWNLVTLIVKGSEILLPRAIWQMKSLRHVHIPGMWLNGLEDHHFCQLEHLDIFSTPHLNSGNETKELLRRLLGLRKLKCYFLERHTGEKPYNFPELSRLNDLESLKVFSFGLVFFGQNLDQFPAFDFPSSLRRLTLGRFTLPWRAISIIGQLPNLEVLKLRSRAFSGQRWDTEEGEFLNLRVLELWQLDIQEWNVPDEPFPSLERLVVKDCYGLNGIPSSLGYITTLKTIEMRWCFQASRSAREILEEQQEMGNDELQVIVLD